MVYSKGWGVQRVGEGVQINAQTIFPAASLTKPVFAYGALLLVRDGRLGLDRSLSDYLYEPYIQGDDRIHKITAAYGAITYHRLSELAAGDAGRVSRNR